eukprot:CAMPEP_0170171934 /NCGR_PEP_ID=MMETSP0040_2-20121228/5144_1 /TAXON_ID=641309 /ORGANISM="Lotharella oceanica, Strain CCMP622" /LENGTH=61 /DNA_ID=CAMNT_0010412297 /DNA_START=349 /DNA_END=534 /DNA_ORIENTATION=-
MKFAIGTFDELGFFHSQLDEIPDSEAKKPKESHLRAMERDREYAKQVLRSIRSQSAQPARM